jgi:predicted dienelactone hydrolase
MNFRRFCLLAATAWLVCATASAQQEPPAYYSVPAVDAPELAHRGSHGVGVRTLQVVNQGQVDILNFDKESGKAPLYDRPLTLEVWYPAVITEGVAEHTVYGSAMPRGPGSFSVAGKASRDAQPAREGPFPLVVVSHGYPGTRAFLSYLTENLASKGYVVAAIDHTDSVFGDVKAFTSTLLNRAADQLFTIDAIEERSGRAYDFLLGVVVASRVAIVGYSMGG